MIEALEKGLLASKLHPSIFYELNRIQIEAVMTNNLTVLCDMPEILNRMKISSLYSLSDMQEMFN